MMIYKYGAMSSKFSLQAENKLTAYAAMIYHFGKSAHLIAIYEPKESKKDSWLNVYGNISERLDEVFGGVDSFDEYVSGHIEDIKSCMATIKRIV